MTSSYENLISLLKRLPGIGYRGAERIALHLLLERPEEFLPLLTALENARGGIRACERCGNLAEEELCEICRNPKRDKTKLCVVERVPDLISLERSGVYSGLYHVLGGRLSPINGVGPERLSLDKLKERVRFGDVQEVVLALSNDIEGEATCHCITHKLLQGIENISVSRIAFGIPSGASLTYSDQVTLRSAFDGRRKVEYTHAQKA